MEKTIEGIHISTGVRVMMSLQEAHAGRMEQLTTDPAEVTNRHLPYIAPGLVDLQLNGFNGINLNAWPLTAQDVSRMTRMNFAEGVTSYCPTIITSDSEKIERIVRVIDQACLMDPLVDACILGIHLEGPFISPEDGPRGAHDPRFVQPPDWEMFLRWQEAANGRIRLITLSPEWDQAIAFIDKCVQNGVNVSIGHTKATGDQIKRAVSSGARLSTHLGNGAHLQLPRHPHYIWDQLAEDELWASVIADGFHLPESVLKVFYKVKKKKLILVSDAVHLAGLKPGAYKTPIGGDVMLLESGKLHMTENSNYLAGSAQMLPAAVAFMMRSGICTLAEAWEMASVRPAQLMKLSNLPHSLSVGCFRDFVFFSVDAGRIVIKEVYKNNRKVWSKSEHSDGKEALA